MSDKATFIPAASAAVDQFDWGAIGWRSRPATTGAQQLVTMETILEPGFGHDFHVHPRQEETIVVVDGHIEAWVEEEYRMLGPGDAVFIPMNTVHASFNDGDHPVRLIVSLAPCIGDEGYELVEVHTQTPWRDARANR